MSRIDFRKYRKSIGKRATLLKIYLRIRPTGAVWEDALLSRAVQQEAGCYVADIKARPAPFAAGACQRPSGATTSAYLPLPGLLRCGSMRIVVLLSQADGLDSLEFVLHNGSGSWDNNNSQALGCPSQATLHVSLQHISPAQ